MHDAGMARALITDTSIQRSILVLRGQRVLLDADLARLYGVETKVFNQAVKRNRKRFPADFMFQLSASEAAALRCQSVTSSAQVSLRSQTVTSKKRGGRRYLPWAFTQEGVAMLSGILSSPRAIAVNIEIMRAFVHMRGVLAANADLAKRLALVESELGRHAAEFGHHKAETVRALKTVFETLRALAEQVSTPAPEPPRRPVGFQLA
jgi:hypothetical protein